MLDKLKKIRRAFTKRKIIAVGMLLLVSGCFFIVSNNQQQDIRQEKKIESMPGWERDKNKKITLNWYVNYSWFVTPWGNNLVSKTMTKETGVNIHFMTPMGNEEEKLNALVASDSLPDIITIGWWEPQVSQMLKEDMVYPLNKLADKYDAYFWKVSDPDIIKANTMKNGNIYYYPNSTYKPADLNENKNIASNQTFLVRKDIYEAIGSPDMSTTEGFAAAVKKASQMFPMVDGQPLIPIGSHVFDDRGCTSFDQYLQNFLAIPYEKDGKAYDRYTDPEFLRWLKMFRELRQEGYLSNDIFVDQRTQMEEKLAQGRYFCMLFQRTDIADQEKILYKNNPDSIYIAVNGPKNSNGSDYMLPTNGIKGWTITLISKNCKHPDRAIEFLDYMMSEQGQKLAYLGVKGKTYTEKNKVPVLKKDVSELLNTDRKQYDAMYGADNTYWMLQNNVMQLKWKQPLQEPLGQMEAWTYPYTKYLGEYDTNLPEDTKAGMADTKITILWGETLPKLLIAKSDAQFDAIISDFKAKREALGYELVMQEKTDQIKQAKKELGME